MDAAQIMDMITTNRDFIKRKSSIALQNLSMLHRSFDGIEDDECRLGLALNDSLVAMVFNTDYARCIEISEAALERYGDAPYDYLLAQHEGLIGRSYTFMTRYDLSREYLQRAERRLELIPPGERRAVLLANVLHDMAMNNNHSGGTHASSVEFLDRALELLADTEFKLVKGICLMGKGNIRFNETKYEEALAYHTAAIPFFEGNEHFGNLSAVMCNIGICLISMGRLDEAEPYLMRALDLRTRIGSYQDIANSYCNLSLLYTAREDYDKAYETLLISRDYALIGQAKGLKLMILEELETVALLKGDTTAAELHRMQYSVIEEEGSVISDL